jgi:hypothetical protein
MYIGDGLAEVLNCVDRRRFISHLFRFVEVLEFFGGGGEDGKTRRASLVRLCGEVEETLPPPEPASISRLQHTGSSLGFGERETADGEACTLMQWWWWMHYALQFYRLDFR